MSNTAVAPNATETQQMRIVAPVGVSTFISCGASRNLKDRLLTERCAFAATHILLHRWSELPRPNRFFRIPCQFDKWWVVTVLDNCTYLDTSLSS